MAEFRETSGKAAVPTLGAARLFAFDDFRFNPRTGELWQGRSEVKLTPRAAAVLALLAERAQQVITKQELFDGAWEGRLVGDEALTSCIQELRRVLGDDARQPRYIETRHRRGYRLIVPVMPSGLGLADKPSIAVLPFDNLSPDPEEEYFADGMVEDIITALSRFKSLFVIARNSSFTYKGKAVDIRQVGHELGVRYVLKGSIRKAGGRVRITGQLIDSEAGAHLWADRFEGSLDDVFDLQDQVATSVVGAIAPKLDQAEIERAKRRPADNLDAYDCFLWGMANLSEKTKDADEEAIRLFSRAIERDPDFATPYGMAAYCYCVRRIKGWVVDGDWERAEARRLAMRVAVIGGDDARALCFAGAALYNLCREYEAGTALIDRALSINRNLARGWDFRGWASVFLGQHESAIEQFARALRLSPLDPEICGAERGIAAAYVYLGRHDQSLYWAARVLAQQPDEMPTLRVAAVAYALAGNIKEARTIGVQICRLDPALRLSNLRDSQPHRRPEDFERFAEGLRLAGVPD